MHNLTSLKEQWLDILPRFKNLKIFRGQGLWHSIGNEVPKMHGLIMKLVQLCPNLHEIDHSSFYDKFGAFKRVVVVRLGDQPELIGYHAERPRPRYASRLLQCIADTQSAFILDICLMYQKARLTNEPRFLGCTTKVVHLEWQLPPLMQLLPYHYSCFHRDISFCTLLVQHQTGLFPSL